MEEYYNDKIKQNAKTRKIKKMIFNFIYVLLIIAVFFETAILVKSRINPEITPDLFGIKIYSIISGSMEPEIKINDLIFVKRAKLSEINVGDIITFIEEGETITHRIINIEQDKSGNLQYRTKGDSNNTEDEKKVRFEKIEGKYFFRIPKLGKVFLLLQNKVILFFVIGMLIMLYLFDSKNSSKKMRRKQERIKYEKEQK